MIGNVLNNLYLFQPQYSVEFRSEKNYWLPYSVGCLWSYAKSLQDISDVWTCKDIFFRRDPSDQILDRIDHPALCAFSCYQWNKNYCINLAEKIKQQWPTVKIVFGGPEVNVTWLEHPWIDSIILGEGEIAFVEVLRAITAGSPIKKVYEKQRIENLDNLPSPYASGIFDGIIKANPGVKWATTLETNRGCPFACTFCDWGSVTYSKVRKFPMSRVQQDLEWIAVNPICYIFCADANFGIFKDRDVEISKLILQISQQNPTLESFNATFNKNNNEWSFKILEILGPLNRGFTVSVQSMNHVTLKAIKRENLGINDLENIFSLCNKFGIHSYTELILGLPLETRETWISGVCQLLELGQHNHLEVWFTDLLTNSELATSDHLLKYQIKTVDTTNYLTLQLDSTDACPEYVKLVNSTSTMKVQDMIESFLYAWMIVNFHMQGYSQVIARYLRRRHSVSFRHFYDTFFSKIQQDTFISPIVGSVRTIISNLLLHGQLPNKLSGHNLIFVESHKIYKLKSKVVDILIQMLDEYEVDDRIIDLQEKIIFDVDASYPIPITVDFNIKENNCLPTQYEIWPKISPQDLTNFDNVFYTMRRKGSLKNNLVITKKID